LTFFTKNTIIVASLAQSEIQMPLVRDVPNNTGNVAKRTADLLLETKLLLISTQTGISVQDVMDKLGVSRATANRYIEQAGGYSVGRGKWQADPTPSEVNFALAVVRRLPSMQTT
jgi:hypothetical protein